MVIYEMKYPSGKKFIPQAIPAMISPTQRGMNLEKELKDSNTYYKEINRALIYKNQPLFKLYELIILPAIKHGL